MLRTLLPLLLLPGLLAAAGPDVVLITLDTTRADALSCYGGPSARTPFLDALAGRSTRYEAAYTPVPQTLPAHASILTGLYPFQHGVRDNLVDALAAGTPTLATLLKGKGYATGAVVASAVLDRRFGLGAGFDRYDDAMPAGRAERRAEEVTDRALGLLKELKPPRFLWVHYYDPHHPYDPPAGFGGGAPYYGEAAYMDREIGRLLKAVDLEGTLVVAAGDHGESLREHGELEHGVLLYEPAVRVPLLIHRPGQAKGSVEPATVSLTWLAPTLLGALGFAAPSAMGLTTLDARGGDPPAYLETIYPFRSYRWSPLKGIVWKGHKLITSSSIDELYDLKADPGEARDRAPARPPLLAEMKQKLARLNPEKFTDLRSNAASAVPADLQKQIQSLGYLQGAALDGSSITGDLPHPRDVADIVEFVQLEGPALLKAGDLSGLMRRIKAVLKRDPRNFVVMNLAGEATWAAGNPERALEIFTQALAIEPDGYYLAGNRGRMLFLLKRYAESEAEIRRALELNPHYPEGFVYLFDSLVAQDKTAEAERLLKEADARGIALPRLDYDRGVLLMGKDRCREAVPLFQRALAGEPGQPKTLMNLAYCSDRLGRGEAAWGYMLQGLQAAPEDFGMLKTAFGLALRQGREADARKIASDFTRLFPMTEEARAMRGQFPDLP